MTISTVANTELVFAIISWCQYNIIMLTSKRSEIVRFMKDYIYSNGYPPSVREIAEAVHLKSPSSVQAHLRRLEREGIVERNPTKPRAITLHDELWDDNSDLYGNISDDTDGDTSKLPMQAIAASSIQYVPLVGSVAAGQGVIASEFVEDTFALLRRLVGHGKLFMLKVRGDSMIEAGILDGDYVVVRSQPSAENGEIIVAGIPGEEATVKSYSYVNGSILLMPANSTMKPIALSPGDVTIYGRVVAVFRRI
jgi:repressor LexA